MSALRLCGRSRSGKRRVSAAGDGAAGALSAGQGAGAGRLWHNLYRV